MKKLLTLTIILALVAPAMAAETRVWANNGNAIVWTFGHENDVQHQLASREGARVSLVKFDDLIPNLIADGITDANDITLATLRMRCTYIVFMSYADSNVYTRINPMLRDWGPNATWNHSDRDTTTPTQWLGQDGLDGNFSPFQTDVGNYDYGAPVANSSMDFSRPGIGWPGPPESELAEQVGDRYHIEFDVTDLAKDWFDSTVDNHGIMIGLYRWFDGNGVEHGTVQANFAGGDPVGYGEPATDGSVWWGPPIISVYTGAVDPPPPHAGDVDSDGDVDIFDFMDIQANWGWSDGGGVPEPATMSLLALGGLALIRRRKR